jgi:Fe-S-cluster containining protein
LAQGVFFVTGFVSMDGVHHKGFLYSFDPAACCDCGGFCCRGRSGNIWVNAGEVAQIAGFLKKSQVDVIGECLIQVDNRLSIKERYADGQYECVFFDALALQCSIYAARPGQCRLFPFWQYYKDRLEELLAECPGVRLER